MSMILYAANEEEFTSNGLGVLSDAVDADVYEELNGQFELTVQYPVDGIHFSEIAADAFIAAKPNPETDPQPFRIYRITKPMRGIVTIYARHNVYRLSKIVVSPFKAENVTEALQGIQDCAVNTCPFTFWTDVSDVGYMIVAIPKDIWTLLGSGDDCILGTYGGEYEFDKFAVKLHAQRGADRGVSIRYGKNLTDLKQEENIANVYTGVYPFWADSDGNFVQLSEKIVRCEGTYTEDKIMPLDCSQVKIFDEPPTEEDLRAYAQLYIFANDIGKPEISWTVEFVQLEQTEEYKGQALLERVLLGDTVSVIFEKLGVNVSARAVATRYKPLLGRYKNITLGKVESRLTSTIVRQGQEIRTKASTSQMAQVKSTATDWLTNGKGYVLHRRDDAGNTLDTLYMDAASTETAVNILRLGRDGLSYSINGIDGPFTPGIRIPGSDGNDGALAKAESGGVELKVQRINGKAVSWKDNGDGTFSMIGSE